MNLKVAAAAVLSFFLFASCVSHTNSETADSATLKRTAAVLDSSTDWTQPVDGEILSQRYSVVPGVSDKLQVNPDFFSLSEEFKKDELIYPEISGAWSLNTSKLPEAAFSVMNSFLMSFEKGESLEQFFEVSAVYSLVMFKYDFERLYGKEKVFWHTIGEPFCGEGYYECPVRFFFEENKKYNGVHADAMMVIRNSDSGFKIVSVDLMDSAGE